MRVLDHEDRKRRLDKQVLLSGGHFLIPRDFPYWQGLQEREQIDRQRGPPKLQEAEGPHGEKCESLPWTSRWQRKEQRG